MQTFIHNLRIAKADFDDRRVNLTPQTLILAFKVNLILAKLWLSCIYFISKHILLSINLLCFLNDTTVLYFGLTHLLLFKHFFFSAAKKSCEINF